MMKKILKKLNSLICSQKGQGMIEYALIIAFVAGIAAFALNTNLGTAISNAFGSASTAIDNAGNTENTETPR